MAKRTTKSLNTEIDPDDRLMTTREVLAKIPLDRSTLWRLSQQGKFPRPIQITPSRIAWRLSSILKWISERESHPAAARRYFGKTA